MIGFVPNDQFIDHFIIIDFFGEFLETFVKEITAILQGFIHGDKVCIGLIASLISTMIFLYKILHVCLGDIDGQMDEFLYTLQRISPALTDVNHVIVSKRRELYE